MSTRHRSRAPAIPPDDPAGAGDPPLRFGADVPDRLAANQQLRCGEQLVSRNGRLRLRLQPDGNLVLARADTGAGVWASHTAGQAVTHLVMGADGNLACRDAGARPRWATGTWGHPGAALLLTNEGTLLVQTTAGTPLWSSRTWVNWSPHHRLQLVLARYSATGLVEPLVCLVGGTGGDDRPIAPGHRQVPVPPAGSGTRLLDTVLADIPLEPGQGATLVAAFVAPGSDAHPTARALADGGAVSGDDPAIVASAAVRSVNERGQVIPRGVVPAPSTTLVHPLDAQTGTFTVRFRHAGGAGAATFLVRGM